MTDIATNLREVKAQLPEGVRLIAVSKYHPATSIQAAYNAGQRCFGESHAQELDRKAALLPRDIEWHFIGHLQTNKVKYIAPYIAMIQSVDSLRLMREIDKQAAKCGRVIDILLELHIAQEATKYGFTPSACREMLAGGEWRDMSHVRICGVMMMASNVDDEEAIAREFDAACACFEGLRHDFFADSPSFCHCSWGMSHDFPIAVRHGSTMVRVGTTIFGEREYR